MIKVLSMVERTLPLRSTSRPSSQCSSSSSPGWSKSAFARSRRSRFSSRFGRRPPRQDLVDDDFEDDEDDEEEFAPARTVFSSKFGEMRFGEGFDVADGREREKGSAGRSKRR